jgi:endonuclease III
MSATNRAALFGKIHKVLKKHYEPVLPPSDRSALEHLLYACVLENAKHEDVDEVFAKLQKNYFDWNEVRVTSVQELAEVMSAIPDAAESAKRMKRALQSVFEKYYQFDIDLLRKAGLGKAVEALQKFNGVTPFVIDYMTQNALGGHAVPTNTAALAVLVCLDAVNAADASKNRVPGLERAIPKNKGLEFASLLHQFAVDFGANPQTARVKSIIVEIDPQAKDRIPKKAPTPPPAPAPIKRVLPPPTIPPGGKPAVGGKPLPPRSAPEPSASDKTEKAKQAKQEPKKVAKPTSSPKQETKSVKAEGKSKSSGTGLTRKKPK